MLATMRPSHTYSHTSSVHSRPESRASSNGASPTASPTRSKAEKMKADVASGSAGKQALLQKKLAKQHAAEIEVSFSKASAQQAVAVKTAQIPGLISLTKPLSEHDQTASASPSNSKIKRSRGRQQRSSSPSSDAHKSSRGPKKNVKNSSLLAADDALNLLSKSAPSGSVAGKTVQNSIQAEAPSADECSALTWQQELLKLSGNSKKSGNKRNSSNIPAAKHDRNLAQPQPIQENDSSALTWQQELFGSKKKSGPHHDVFADARDAETFGSSGNESKGRRRARAGSVGAKSAHKKQTVDVPLHIEDLFNGAQMTLSHSASSHRRVQSSNVPVVQVADPSTPAKKQGQHPSVAAAIAYAGPNFHNSPSPASLPAPKFSSRLVTASAGSMPSSSLGASSSSASGSDDDYEVRRNVRGTTAPADIGTPSKPSPMPSTEAPQVPIKPATQPGATVESLLARMMSGERLA